MQRHRRQTNREHRARKGRADRREDSDRRYRRPSPSERHHRARGGRGAGVTIGAGSVRIGGAVSTTVKVYVAVAALPESSVAEHLIVFGPSSNLVPTGGVHVTVSVVIDQVGGRNGRRGVGDDGAARWSSVSVKVPATRSRRAWAACCRRRRSGTRRCLVARPRRPPCTSRSTIRAGRTWPSRRPAGAAEPDGPVRTQLTDAHAAVVGRGDDDIDGRAAGSVPLDVGEIADVPEVQRRRRDVDGAVLIVVRLVDGADVGLRPDDDAGARRQLAANEPSNFPARRSVRNTSCFGPHEERRLRRPGLTVSGPSS